MVGSSESVRASRDGDRFHHYWAARRALRLIDLTGDLKVVAVEGLPEGETVPGEEVIDVAEYYGGRDLNTCSRLRLSQLKHSTVREAAPIVASELKTTLEKFGVAYRKYLEAGHAGKVDYAFVANRKLNEKVRQSLAEIRAGRTSFTYAAEAGHLRRYMGFGSEIDEERRFCGRFQVVDDIPGVRETEDLLREELNQFLPGSPGPEMALLMEAVSRRATTLAEDNALEVGDVLIALRCTAEELFPAPNVIDEVDQPIVTRDIGAVVDVLVEGSTNKVLITAVGGAGKSVLTTVLDGELPVGSVTVTYDCFAGGDYRKVSSRRHDYQVALTQMANELAARGLCTPLVPTPASDGLYMRVFTRRVRAAAAQLAVDHPGALLTLLIDAADNAAIAAREQQRSTFVAQLFKEDWPVNVRLVQLCRPERKDLLSPPSAGVVELTLSGFTREETLAHLRSRFPGASGNDGAELHALSGGNPRVQAMAMNGASSVAQAIAAIQLARTAPGDALDAMLAKQVADVSDQGHLQVDELSRLCEALAVLHPPVPVADLAALTNVPADSIRSFAVSLGRGCHVSGDSLQFRDEPTETWFRTVHSPNRHRLRELVAAVEPFAESSSYFATVLPQLLFEAEMLEELVALALSERGLPGVATELQAIEISRSRARFALCATLCQGRNGDAALLAIKAGQIAAGHSRRIKLFRDNTDLAARFLGSEVVYQLCAGRDFVGDWPGANLHVEAALLSHVDEFRPIARGRARSSLSNISAILRLHEDDHRSPTEITANDIADLAMVAVNVDGPARALEFLRGWGPDQFVYRVARKLVRRLLDSGRVDTVEQIAALACNAEPALLALAQVMFEHDLALPGPVCGTLAGALSDQSEPFELSNDYTSSPLRGVVWSLVHGIRSGSVSESVALQVLDSYLPAHLSRSAGSSWSSGSPTATILAFALRAHLRGTTLSPDDLASDELKKKAQEKYVSHQDVQEFHANVGRLVPWILCWLGILLDGPTDASHETLGRLIADDLKPVSDYNTPYTFLGSVSDVATRMLTTSGDEASIQNFVHWHASADSYLGRSRLTVARIASRDPQLEAFGLDVVNKGTEAAMADRTEAELRIDSLIGLARSVLATNETEARALFDAAIKEADQVGDDLYARWQALTNTAKQLNTGQEAARAYRLFQIGEQLNHVNDHIDIRELGECLRRMHEPSYLAHASRARDRRSLHFSHLITPAFESVTTDVDRKALLALYAFEPLTGWKSRQEGLPEDDASPATKVLENFDRYKATSGGREARFDSSSSWMSGEPEALVDPAVRFDQVDFTLEASWNSAFNQLSWRREERRALVAFALDRFATRRADVLDAFGSATRAGEDDFAEMAELAAETQPQTLGVKQALKRLGNSFATRFAQHICTVAWRDERIGTMAAATGIAETDLMQVALQELGRSAYQLSYGGYFLLASHIATTLDGEPVGRVFDALAELFEDLVPSATASDGAHASLPPPPADLATAIAGVLWTSLGDMATETRWQAAHAVVLLAELDCSDVLASLARFADGTSDHAAFVDARFEFYELHARMWLLLALARAALDSGTELLSPFTRWLIAVVQGPFHAANQILAQRTLEMVADREIAEATPGLEAALDARLAPEWIELTYQEQHRRPNPLALSTPDPDEETKRHRFFFDFEQYWCRELADVFGSTAKDVARSAEHIAHTINGYDSFVAQKDARSEAGIYEEGGAYPDRGTWPELDNLAFYVAVHALLGLGANLGSTLVACKDAESEYDAYTEWLAQFLPRRPDGRWLSDRRDPPPTPAPDASLLRQEQHGAEAIKNWPWSIRVDDFEELAGTEGDWITVWSRVDAASDKLSQDSSTDSALVPHDTSQALLIASQTSPHGPSDFRMPTTNDSHDSPRAFPYELTPWVCDSHLHYGIDAGDRCAGGIDFPPVRPADEIVGRFALVADMDLREWSHCGKPVFRCRVWNDMLEHGRDREVGSRGYELQVHRDFLSVVLTELDRSLILQASLRRQTDRPYYERRKNSDDEFEHLERSGKVYVIDPQGGWTEC